MSPGPEPASAPLAALADAYRSPEAHARRFAQAGQPVVGFVGDAMPVELVHAAGLGTLRLKGDPRGDTELARQHHVPRFTAREGIVASILQRLLSGELAFLGHLVVVHDRDSIHRLYQLLAALKRERPELPFPEPVLLDLLHTTSFATSRYERRQLRQLKARLEAWSGRAITDAALHDAIVRGNERRTLVRELGALRRERRVRGTPALQAMGASNAMPHDAYVAALRAFLDAAAAREARPGCPAFVAGTPWDHGELYELLEACGLALVGEASGWGMTAFEGAIATDGDPFEALCDHYHARPPSSRMFPMARDVEHVRERALACGARAAVLAVAHDDRAEAWEAPAKLKALRDAGIAALHLPDLPYALGDAAGLRDRIASFARSLDTGGAP